MQLLTNIESWAPLPTEKEWVQAVVVVPKRVGVVVRLVLHEEAGISDLSMIGLKIVNEIAEKAEGMVEDNLEQWGDYLEEMVKAVASPIELSVGVIVSEGERVKVVGLGGFEARLRRGRIDHKIWYGVNNRASGVVGVCSEGDEVSIRRSERQENKSEVSDLPYLMARWGKVEEEQKVANKLSIRDLGRTIYLGENEKWHKRYMSIGVGVLVLAILLIGIGGYIRSEKARRSEWLEVERVVANELSMAKEKQLISPESAQEGLRQRLEEVGEYAAKKAKGKYRTLAQAQVSKLEAMISEIEVANEAKLNTWMEFELLGATDKPKQLLIDEKGYWYTTVEKKLVAVSLDDKSQVGYGEINLAGIDSIVSEKKLFMLDVGGVSEAIIGNKIEWAQKVQPDEAWQTPARILAYGGNVYVLDKGTGELSKYVVSSEPGWERRRWLGKGVILDLSQVTDIVVDGEVWMTTATGKLLKYSRGVPVKFEIKGGVDLGEQWQMTGLQAIATTDSAVLVLETSKNRIIVLDKEGNYQRQYRNPELGQAKDIVAREGKVYVLFDEAIKFFSLVQ